MMLKILSIFMALLALVFAWLAFGFVGTGVVEFDGLTLIFVVLAWGCAALAWIGWHGKERPSE